MTTARSLAGRLSLSVALTSVAMILLVLGTGLLILMQRINAEMEEQAARSAAFLTESLAVPLWSLDYDAARAVGQALAQDKVVGLVEILDARGEPIYRHAKGGRLLLERFAQVTHDGQAIGAVRLGLNDSTRRAALWTLAGAGAGLVALTIALQFLLQAVLFRPLLRRPFASLDGLVGAYATGDFSPAPPPIHYVEFEPLVNLLLDMGRTIREQMESLRKSEERFSLALDAANDGLWDLDIPTETTFYSPRYYTMLGYEPGEFPSDYESWLDMLHPEDRGRAEAAMAACLDDSAPYEVEFRLRDKAGQWRWILSRGRVVERDADGRAKRMVGTHSDIADRKLAADRLRQSEEKFSRLFRLSPDAIIVVHLVSEQVLDVNEAFCRMFGFERAEAVGKTTRELGIYQDYTARTSVFEKLRAENQVENLEIEARRKDGAPLGCSLSCQVLSIDGEPHILTVFRDITETKKMQEMMIQTEKMLSVGGIAAGIAHEINNPLGIVLQAAQNLTQRTRPDFIKNQEAARSIGLNLALLVEYMRLRKLDVFLDDIQSAALRASAIIRHMLDFSRRSESKRRVCDVAAIADKALALAQNDYDLKKSYDFKQIQVEREYETGLPPIHCTETEIEQVLLNLLRNAAQAMAAVQPPVEAPRIALRLSRQAGSVRIEVEDNGPGMPPDVQRRAFEPFFTTKAPGVGTGLGLSVSYFIVTKGHGGTMRLESKPGLGSRFIIDLPAEEA
ncbi:PAS domain-containing protein [Desulfovibrio aminophilus]|nr:PAS domain-containing sensor histidine kinase [Desulfovibrio aminophilus]MCM0755272.1 PAS domain-containing protein [Desulfovibrio aminophilus]